MTTNPLQKYFRQPKLYVSLPSKGTFYPDGVLQGDPNNVPIFAMTGMDEILMKTPDALFNGESTVKVIESCCPYIKDAKQVPSLDIDSLLVAIRIATFGDKMTVNHVCANCGADNDFEIDLTTVVDHYNNARYDATVEVGGLLVNLRPLTYNELTVLGLENFQLQKMLVQINDSAIEQEEKTKLTDRIYDGIADTQVKVMLLSIESIKTNEVLVNDRDHIAEWLRNSNIEDYKIIKNKLEANKEVWDMPKQTVKCGDCGTDDIISVTMDQSSFFGKNS
jgi:transcription elongation factor Elf1